MINSLKLLTDRQKDGDSPAESIVTSSREKSRKGVMEGLRKFIGVDNHEAVGVGGLCQGIKSAQVVMPQFTADFPEAVIREGAGELTLRAAEVGVRRTLVDATHVEEKRDLREPTRIGMHSARPFTKNRRTRLGNDVLL